MRKYYIDNIRWWIIVLVVIYHVVCCFNSTGVIANFNAPGIPAVDAFAYFVYPWFMPCMFLIAGISAKYSLKKRTNKQFLKERVKKVLIPFIAGMIIIAPLGGMLTSKINNWGETSTYPEVVKIIGMIMSGMGPLWFLIQMFIVSVVFILIKSLDKNDKLLRFGKKANIWVLIALYIPVLISAQLFNAMYTFRNGLFITLFLLGYFVFSHDKVQDELEKYNTILLVVACILFGITLKRFWGQNYADLSVVNDYITLLYGYVMMLAVLANFKAFFNFSNRFTKYMSNRSFFIYLFHYFPMTFIAYYIVTYLKLPMALTYVVVIILSFVSTMIISEVVYRIPKVRSLFGIRKNTNVKELNKVGI